MSAWDRKTVEALARIAAALDGVVLGLSTAALAVASLAKYLAASGALHRIAEAPAVAIPDLRLSLLAGLGDGESRLAVVRGIVRLGGAMREMLDKVVGAHKVVLFKKGTKDFPQCGFSHTVVQILRSLDVPFETLDVLANEQLRQGLKEYSSRECSRSGGCLLSRARCCS